MVGREGSEVDGEGSDDPRGEEEGMSLLEPPLSMSATFPEPPNVSGACPDPDPELSSSPELLPELVSGLGERVGERCPAECVMLLRSISSSETDGWLRAVCVGEGVSRGGPAVVALAHARMLARVGSISSSLLCQPAECFRDEDEDVGCG